MTKPIDETWGHDDSGGLVLVAIVDGKVDVDATRPIAYFSEEDFDDEQIARDAARAALAAEAPLMARWIRDLEWSPNAVSCAFCSVDRDRSHRKDCKWLKMMRRLGERP